MNNNYEVGITYIHLIRRILKKRNDESKSNYRSLHHAVAQYDMNLTGATLSIELREILNLLKTYNIG